MNQSNPEDKLRASLTAFETSLTTPIVSGDLPQWTSEVQKSWMEASAQIHDHAAHLHPRQYDEISKADPELLPRIDLLKMEDTAIETAREKLGQMIARVAQHAPKMEPDEEKAQKRTASLVDDGVAFVARVRKQAVAVQTWFVEAFARDHGAVD